MYRVFWERFVLTELYWIFFFALFICLDGNVTCYESSDICIKPQWVIPYIEKIIAEDRVRIYGVFCIYNMQERCHAKVLSNFSGVCCLQHGYNIFSLIYRHLFEVESCLHISICFTSYFQVSMYYLHVDVYHTSLFMHSVLQTIAFRALLRLRVPWRSRLLFVRGDLFQVNR